VGVAGARVGEGGGIVSDGRDASGCSERDR